MSQRARAFVEYWISEFLHPDCYEDEESFSESLANANECIRSAARRGISRNEIEEEFRDLASLMAQMHQQLVDAELRRTFWRPI
jgi:hypothetical protein